MKKTKTFFNLVPMMLLWLVLSVIGWGFVFTRITTYAPEEKMALYVDGEVPGQKALAQLLDEEKAEGIRMVDVRPFSYAMFGGDELRNADLFILPVQNAGQYLECFAPWPDAMEQEGEFFSFEGVAYGRKVYDAATGEGVAKAYIAYENHLYASQDYYLFFGNQSRHLQDGLAVRYAQRLMNAE